MSALHRHQIFDNRKIDYLDKINFRMTWENHIYEPSNMLISQFCQLEFEQSGDTTGETNKGSVQSSSGIIISEQRPTKKQRNKQTNKQNRGQQRLSAEFIQN